MKIGLGIGVTQPQNMPMASVGSPSYLFRDGTQGTWYDPSDINLTWRRNLLTYSEQFDNAVWDKSATTLTANAAVAPDGTTTADRLTDSAVNTVHGVYRDTIPFVVGVAYILSIRAKPDQSGWLFLGSNAGGAPFAYFNLSNGTVGNYQAGTTPTISADANGFYVCSIAFTAASTGIRVAAFVAQGNGTVVYAGTAGLQSIYIWGAQLEQGSTATPYQRITDGIQDYLQYQAQPVMYRDAAGTTPAVLEQPVGLMLDKSKGLVLGPELVTNGDFSQGTTGWTIGANIAASVVAGEAVVNFAGSLSSTANNWFAANSPSTANKRYRIEFDATYVSGGDLQAGTDWTIGKTITGASNAGVKTRYSLDVSSQATRSIFGLVTFGATTTATWKLDNISVRELPGNHAFNSSGNSANFPVLSARYNLLTKTEDFSDAAWSTLGTVTRTPNYAVAPDGTTTAQRVLFSQNASTDQIFQTVAVSNATYLQGVWLKVPSGSAQIKFGYYDGAIKTSALTLTTTWQYFTSAQLLTSGAGARCLWLYPDGAGYATEIYVWHPDIRVANDALGQPAYQRVNTSTDYDTVGFKPYLRFNGTNQWLQTNSIDFSYGDKMFVSAGVRKLSTSTAVAIDTSASAPDNNGTFGVYGPDGANQYTFFNRGTASVIATTASSTLAAPITNVLSGIGNISGDQAALRVNGTQAAISTADQGTGNYGNYPLYIGARAGSSLWFNGRLYGMVVAGKQASAVEIDKTEDYIALKTGFTYPKISGVPTFTVV